MAKTKMSDALRRRVEGGHYATIYPGGRPYRGKEHSGILGEDESGLYIECRHRIESGSIIATYGGDMWIVGSAGVSELP